MNDSYTIHYASFSSATSDYFTALMLLMMDLNVLRDKPDEEEMEIKSHTVRS